MSASVGKILTETELQGPNQKRRHNRDVLSALIITLQDLDIYPKSPYEWIVKDKGRILKPSRKKLRDDADILDEVKKAASRKNWNVASQGHNGMGLEIGEPNIELMCKILKYLKWQRPEEVVALKAQMQNALRSSEKKVSMLGGHYQEKCPHGCGCEEPSDEHVIWTCSKLGTVEDIWVKETQSIRHEIDDRNPGKWLRGIAAGYDVGCIIGSLRRLLQWVNLESGAEASNRRSCGWMTVAAAIPRRTAGH